MWLGVDSASSLFRRHVQDVLLHRKPYLKVDGRAGSSPVQEGGKGCLRSCHGDVYSRTQHVTSDASPPLSLLLPPTCLQVSVSAAWAAHVKCRVNPVTRALLAKTSHSVALPSLNSNSITSPRSLFLFEKKNDIHGRPAVSSLGPGFTRLLLMYSLRSDHCGSASIFGEVPKYFWLLNRHHFWQYGPREGFLYPLTFSDTFGWLSCFVYSVLYIYTLDAVVGDIWLH